jgi:threonine/homoserine/homoserine lactone efflux protein
MFIPSFILGIVYSAPLGPTNIEVVRRGFKYGFKDSFSFYCGGMGADLLYLLLIIFGFSSFSENSFVKIGLGLFGMFVLLYLAFEAIKDSFKLELKTSKQIQHGSTLLSGFLVTLANPTTFPSWLAMYGILVSHYVTEHIWIQLLAVLLGTLLIGLLYSSLCHFGRKYANKTILKIISFVSGFILLEFAGYFGYGLLNLFFL